MMKAGGVLAGGVLPFSTSCVTHAFAGELCSAYGDQRCTERFGDLLKSYGGRFVGRRLRAFQEPEARRLGRGGPGLSELTGKTGQSRRQKAPGCFLILAQKQQIVTAQRAEIGNGRILDRNRLAQPDSQAAPVGGRAGVLQQFSQGSVGRDVGNGASLEYERGHLRLLRDMLMSHSRNQIEPAIAIVVIEPDNLERVVAVDQAVGVVVNRLARPGEQAGRVVFFLRISARPSRCIARRYAPPSDRWCCAPGYRRRPEFASPAPDAIQRRGLAAPGGRDGWRPDRRAGLLR